MFADGKKFDMGKPHIRHIGDQPVGHRVPGQIPALFVAVPRPGMDFIDADGLAPCVGRGPEVAMFRVTPFMRDNPRHRRRGGPHFGKKSKRVGLERQLSPPKADNLEFVGAPLANIGNENLPDPRIAAFAHTVPLGFQSLKSPTTETRCALAPRPRNARPRRRHARSDARPACHTGGNDGPAPSVNRPPGQALGRSCKGRSPTTRRPSLRRE